ncbi:MAG TPA: thiolase family protein, partial [Negativicutes bacterium]|nr:thiolase family protein [Negativicutes bacterium]
MREAVIVSAVRTPVGKFRGALATVPAHVLGALTIREAVKRAGIKPSMVEEVVFGNLYALQCGNIARVALLEAELPVEVPGITLNRACGSGLNAIAYAAILIEAGYNDIVVAGGVESDSTRPWVMSKAEQPLQLTPPAWIKRLLTPPQMGNPAMIDTAENLAEKYRLTRQECDEFALLSHQKAAVAWEKGYFDEQIIPVEVNISKSKKALVTMDETFRKESTLESLAKLPVVSGRENGIVTAGNSSPLSDGSGAVVVMEKSKAKALG